MSPDLASKAEAVPYSDFSDPQSLSLYGYVRNNPVSRLDADGHAAEQGNSNGWWDPSSFFQFVRDSTNGGRHQTGGAALLARGTALLLQFEEEAIENEARDAEVERESEALRPYSKNK
jgi:hypothetical protein